MCGRPLVHGCVWQASGAQLCLAGPTLTSRWDARHWWRHPHLPPKGNSGSCPAHCTAHPPTCSIARRRPMPRCQSPTYASLRWSAPASRWLGERQLRARKIDSRMPTAAFEARTPGVAAVPAGRARGRGGMAACCACLRGCCDVATAAPGWWRGFDELLWGGCSMANNILCGQAALFVWAAHQRRRRQAASRLERRQESSAVCKVGQGHPLFMRQLA